MRSEACHVLFIDSVRIRVWDCGGPEANFVGEFPNERGLRSLLNSQCLPKHSRLNIFVDTDSVLFSTIPMSATGRTNHQAATYEAEPYFPIAAEDMLTVVDVDSSGTASCLVIDRSWFEPIRQSLAEHGFQIQQIVPTTPVIALAAIMASSKTAGHKTASHVWIERDKLVETLIIRNLRLQAWTCEPKLGHADIDQEVEDTSQRMQVDQQANSEISHFAYSTTEAYERAAIKAFKQISPSIKRGKIALDFPLSSQSDADSKKRQWEAVVIVACLVMLIVAAVCWVRGQQYQKYAQLADQEMTRLAKESFPNQRVGSLKRSLDAELQTVQRELETWRLVANREAVVKTLLNFLKSVPDQPKIGFRLLDVQPGMIRIEGDAKELESVSEFAETLRQSGMNVNEKKYGLQFELEVVPPVEDVLTPKTGFQASSNRALVRTRKEVDQ